METHCPECSGELINGKCPFCGGTEAKDREAANEVVKQLGEVNKNLVAISEQLSEMIQFGGRVYKVALFGEDVPGKNNRLIANIYPGICPVIIELEDEDR